MHREEHVGLLNFQNIRQPGQCEKIKTKKDGNTTASQNRNFQSSLSRDKDFSFSM